MVCIWPKSVGYELEGFFKVDRAFIKYLSLSSWSSKLSEYTFKSKCSSFSLISISESVLGSLLLIIFFSSSSSLPLISSSSEELS